MLTSSFYSLMNKAPKSSMKHGQGKSHLSLIDAPRLTATPQCGRGRGREVRRPTVVPVGGPSATAPVHVDEHVDDDSEKENKPYDIEGAEVEEEEEEGDFEWKCRLLDIIQQYPEVYDLAHPCYKNKDFRDQAWDEIATGMDAIGNLLNISYCASKFKTL